MEYHFDSKLVKIRQPHNCWGCTNLFFPPEKMTVVTSVDEGIFLHVYWCNKCQKLINSMDHHESEYGFEYGELIELQESGCFN